MISGKLGIRLFLLAMVASAAVHAQDAVKIAPDNPKYLWFRGKPLVLISASEHYGSVINRPFDYEKYLANAAEHKMTMTRTFLLYRELQSVRNPSSPCKPDSPDYISPFVRSGPPWMVNPSTTWISGIPSILSGCTTFWTPPLKMESWWS
jgi:hypothetical protein